MLDLSHLERFRRVESDVQRNILTFNRLHPSDMSR